MICSDASGGYDRDGTSAAPPVTWSSRKLVNLVLCASARKLPALELHPALLDQEGLRPALCALVEDNFKSSGIRTLLEFEPAIGRMSPNVELTLYRLAQQALSNARSHSESKTAHVRVHGHNAANEITLVVEDDGKGLPGTGSAPSILRKQVPFVVQNGLGLSEMRERANRVGGRIEVDSTVGRTVIRAIIPLASIGRPRT